MDSVESAEGLPIEGGDQFWSAPAGLTELAIVPVLEVEPALKRLGPLAAARPGFPLMGFLATVYEQISSHAKETLERSRK